MTSMIHSLNSITPSRSPAERIRPDRIRCGGALRRVVLLMVTALLGCSAGSVERSIEPDAARIADSVAAIATECKRIPTLALDAAIALVNRQTTREYRLYREILAIDSTHTPTLEALARWYDRHDLHDSVAQFALRARAHGDSSTTTLRLIANALSRLGRHDDALDHYARLLERRPNDLEARYLSARIVDRRRPVDALRHYEHIRDHVGSDYLTMTHLYELQAMAGAHTAAAITANELVLLEPGEPTFHEMVVNARISFGDIDGATLALRRAELMLEDSAMFRAFIRSELLLSDLQLHGTFDEPERFGLFVDSLVAITMRHPSLPSALRFRAAMISLRTGRIARGRSILATLVARAEIGQEEWIEAGRYALERGEPAILLETLDGAADRFDGSYEALYLLGAAARRVGNDRDALSRLKSAVAIYPEYGEAWGEMARVYVDADDLPRALNTFERAVAEAPYEPEILNDFARLLAENDIRLERADDLIERALEVDPEASGLLTTKGLVAERRHDFAAADSVVSIAITLDGPTAERLEILGDARVGLGHTDEGLAAWRESLRIALEASGENSAADRSRVKRLREKIDRAGAGREDNGANGAE